MLDDIVDSIGEENVVQIVTDNAANYKAAGERLMQKRKSLYWIPCVAYCVDLILEDFEKKLAIHIDTITKAKKISTYIYSRTILISMLRHFTKERNIVCPAVIRFATTYLNLGSLNEHKGGLMAMFTSSAWKTSRYAATIEGKRIYQYILDGDFWKSIGICLKAAYPLIKVLRLADSDEKPAMGFIYDAMDQAKRKIPENFNNAKKSYEPIWDVIDQRRECQMHRPLHATAYYLNPRIHYRSDFKVVAHVKIGLYYCLERMVPDEKERDKIDLQLENFKDAKGLFGLAAVRSTRETKPLHKWWDSYGDECLELQRFAIRILSLTCSSSGCERNWIAFEMIHTKKRNRLHQKKMNDLVFVMYNLKLQDRKTGKENDPLSFEDLESDDEWKTKECEKDDLEYQDQFSLLCDTENDTENQEEDILAMFT